MRVWSAFVLSVAFVAGCDAQDDAPVGEGTGAISTREIDPSAFAVVSVQIASGPEAKAFDTELTARGARTFRGGKAHFVGLSRRELDGKAFEPSEPSRDIYGIWCGEAETETQCTLRGVVRAADVQTTLHEGMAVPVRTVVSGKLAAGIAGVLPVYRPLDIACTSAGKGTETETRCTVPSTGFGVAMTVDRSELPREEAIGVIRLFFPNG